MLRVVRRNNNKMEKKIQLHRMTHKVTLISDIKMVTNHIPFDPCLVFTSTDAENESNKKIQFP